MRINFDQIRNRPVRIYKDRLEIGGYRLRFGDMLNLNDPLGIVSVQSIAQSFEQLTELTKADCPVQLAVLAFTATNNFRALDFYFPITKMLTASEAEHFYQFMQDIALHANFDLQFIGENRTNLTAQMPVSAKYVVAGHVAEVFFYRRDILARFLATPRHIQLHANLRAFKQDGGVAGGDYSPQRGSIQLVLARLFEGFFGETAGVSPFLHEFGHMLDSFNVATGRLGQGEGLLPGLRPSDGTLFNERARKLFISGKRLELERYLVICQGALKTTDVLPIGHPYVFQNDGEFIAGYFEMFFRNPNYFAAQNQDLYEAFVELFGYDPRNAWKQDFPFYINENRSFYLSGQRPGIPNLTIPKI